MQSSTHQLIYFITNSLQEAYARCFYRLCNCLCLCLCCCWCSPRFSKQQPQKLTPTPTPTPIQTPNPIQLSIQVQTNPFSILQCPLVLPNQPSVPKWLTVCGPTCLPRSPTIDFLLLDIHNLLLQLTTTTP